MGEVGDEAGASLETLPLHIDSADGEGGTEIFKMRMDRVRKVGEAILPCQIDSERNSLRSAPGGEVDAETAVGGFMGSFIHDDIEGDGAVLVDIAVAVHSGFDADKRLR